MLTYSTDPSCCSTTTCAKVPEASANLKSTSRCENPPKAWGPGPGRVQCPGDQVWAFHARRFGEEMPAHPNGAAVAGVQGFNGVGRTDHLPYLGVVVQERDKFAPGVAPQPNCCRVAVTQSVSKASNASAAALALTAV
jgi:hypothetical protein